MPAHLDVGPIRLEHSTSLLEWGGAPSPVVLVSSDDTWLTAGGGVSERVLAAAGPEVADEMRDAVLAAGGELALGATVATRPGSTGARAIVHAVVVDWMRDRVARRHLLAGLVLRVLDHAMALGARTVVLPSLGTGSAGISREEFTHALGIALREHVAAPTRLRRLRLVSLDAAAPFPTVRKVSAVASVSKLAPTRIASSRKDAVASGQRGARPEAIVPLERAVRAACEELARRPDRVRAFGLEPPAHGAGTPGWLADAMVAAGAAGRVSDALRRVDRQTGGSPTEGPDWVGRWRDAYVALASELFAEQVSSGGGAAWGFATTAAHVGGIGAAAAPGPLGIVAGAAAAPGPMGFLVGAAATAVGLGAFRCPSEPPPAFTLPRSLVDEQAAFPVAPAGDTPAARLADLLLAVVPPDRRAFLLETLHRQGCRGGDRERVTEYVLRDGARVALTTHTTPVERWTLGLERGGLNPEDMGDDAAAVDAVLLACGVRVAPPPRGLKTFWREAARLRRLAETEPGTADARVVSTGRLIEELLKHYIRFHARAHFGLPADSVVRPLGVRAEQGVGKLGLGTLLGVTHAMTRRLLATPPDEAGARFRALYGERHLLPGRLETLSTVRNNFTHDAHPVRIADVRRFFDEAAALIDHLGAGDPPLFPSVVAVRAVREGECGAIWEARDDEGLDERIHTDQALAVGERYYMVPRSNPIRVFPLLVPVAEPAEIPVEASERGAQG